jgi:serine/threonine protein phosphatase PrpC
MFFQRKTLWLPKDLGHDNEYQDAYALDAREGIAAIADGVSSSMFARRWAQILTRGIVEEAEVVLDPEQLSEWLSSRREEWSESIDEAALAWHQKAKLRDGAHSTLLWMSLSPADEAETYHLTAHNIGDCLLLHCRDDELLASFPFDSADQFNQETPALCSIGPNDDATPSIETFETECQVGDLLVLCSDAFGAFALAQQESQSPIDWHALWQQSQEDWSDEIQTLRDESQIRFDDTTVVMLKLLDHAAFADGIECHPPLGQPGDRASSPEAAADESEEEVDAPSDEEPIEAKEDGGESDA